ncbi:MAG: hypothetical protein BWX99_02543 [Deltaproteobacteria bacterium ADurb.Bin151]|nr:MAG: hypothetical protein BWX99_02543 [Deltaproteobacteria bacterium ADurb.Bin151]
MHIRYGAGSRAVIQSGKNLFRQNVILDGDAQQIIDSAFQGPIARAADQQIVKIKIVAGNGVEAIANRIRFHSVKHIMAHREAVTQDTVIFRIEDHPGLSH